MHDGFIGYNSILIVYNRCSESREHFVGMYVCSDSKAATLFAIIQDVLCRLGLPLTSLQRSLIWWRVRHEWMYPRSAKVDNWKTAIRPISVCPSLLQSCNHVRDTLHTARGGANIVRESSKRQAGLVRVTIFRYRQWINWLFFRTSSANVSHSMVR